MSRFGPFAILIAALGWSAAALPQQDGKSAARLGPVPAPAVRRPAMTEFGPYGSPLAMTPAYSVAAFQMPWDDGPGRAGASRAPSASGTRLAIEPGSLPAGVPKTTFQHDGEEELPDPPGTLSTMPTRVPGLPLGKNAKSGIVAPHTKPDLEMPLSRRTSIGMFGEVGQLELETRSGIVPTVRAKEIGAGVTLQYRFGQ